MLGMKHVYRNEADENGEGGGGEAAPAVNEVEQKARKMGWTPKEEFKGDPEKWRSAEEFVERGENMVPILRDTVRKQERKIADLERNIAEIAVNATKSEQRAVQKALSELKARQIEAVAAGNTEAFVQIDQEIEDLHKQALESQPKPKGPPPEYVEWEEKNTWVRNDPVMLAYAESQFEYLKRTKPGMLYSEVLESVSKAVKKEFPDKFSNPRRESAPSVEGSTPSPKKGGKTYADLPKEAKEACDRFVERYKVKREDYVKQYFEGE